MAEDKKEVSEASIKVSEEDKRKDKEMKGYKRFVTFNSLNGSEHEEYFEPKMEAGEYVVDDSSFIPMEEAIKQLKNSGMTAEEINQSYDFPNGIDSGIEVPLSRQADMKDIAEISTNIMQQVDELSEHVATEKEYQKKQKDFNKSVNQIRSKNVTTE